MPTIIEIADVFNGKTPSKGEQRNEGLPILKIRDIDENGKFVGIFGSYVDKDFYKKYSRKKLRAGDTIILNAAHSADYVGNKNALVSEDLDGTIATGEWLIVRPKKADSSFINHFLKSPEGRQKIKKEVKGIHLYPKDVERIKIPLPTIVDQIRIATLLSRVEALIATRKDNLRLLDEFLKSTFLEMFGDPVRNEKEFEVRHLNEFYIDPKNGTKCGPFGSALKKEEYVKSGVPVWNMDNISKDGRLQPDVNLWITDDKFEKLKGYSTINGDVIISRAGTVGKMCVLNTLYPKSIISTNLIRVRFGQGLLSIYFVSLMTYCKGRVGKLRTGPDGAFSHMNTGILDKLHFPYPPIELQNQFATIVDKVEPLKTLYQQNLSELENLYGVLSQKAFKGKLNLNRIPLEKVPEEPVSDTTTEPTDPFAKIDSFAMSDPAEREQLLLQLFDAFIAERKGASFSLDDFWTQAEQRVVDDMDEESPPLGVADYDKAKAWLFELLKSGQADQRFNEENNRMELSIKG